MGALDAASSIIRASSLYDPGGLKRLLGKDGRFPSVDLVLTPLGGNLDGRPTQISLNRFLQYSFKSSIIIPVDTFSFSFVAPDDDTPANQLIKSGDIARLDANQITVSTGIIDSSDIEVTAESGEMVTITGRDLMGQYEDNDAISIDDTPIWKNSYTV